MDFKEASVQYGDLRGEVAIDGYAGPPLFEMGKLANIPAEYFPIGFYLSGGEGTFPAGTILLSVAAVEKEKYPVTIILQFYIFFLSSKPREYFNGKNSP